MLAHRLLRFGARTVVMLIAVSCSSFASSPEATPTIDAQSVLTQAERTQLTALEARPLVIPAMPADGNCPDGPQSKATPFGANSATDLAETGGMLYGTGPVYFLGGPETDGRNNIYFDVSVFTDPTVQGVVLLRAHALAGQARVVMVGSWTAGPPVGMDVIGGQRVALHPEFALPASRRPSKAGVAPGWGLWEVRLGIDKSASCLGFQIDGTSGTEVFVVAG